MNINDVLQKAVAFKASDVHIRSGAHPYCRIHGKILPLKDFPILSSEDTANVASQLMSLQQKKIFKETHDVDLSYALGNFSRFRVNVFQERNATGVVFRTVNAEVKTLKELNLPPILKQIAGEQRGLVLVTGATGSGKSTTLAAMINHINETEQAHILTIEDPIEYVHRNKQSVISQREVGSDTVDFNQALRAALRQDPDVILVGEMRDKETVDIGSKAAETGHLVFATLHTVDATDTINRLVSFYPMTEQEQVRISLSSVIKSIISQRLIRKVAGGRVAALEIMISTERIKDMIKDKVRSGMIKDAIEQGASQYGMQSFDQAIFALEHSGVISREDALEACTNPDEYILKMEGFSTTSESSIGHVLHKQNMDGDEDAKPASRSDKIDDFPFDQNPFEQ